MWDLPRPGIEPVSPASAVRLLAHGCFALQEWSDGVSRCWFQAPWGLCCLARPPLLPCPCVALPTHQLPSHPSRLGSSAAPSAELPQTPGAGLLTPSPRLRVLCLCWCFFRIGWTVFPSLSLFLDPVSHLDRNTVLGFRNPCLVHSRHSVNWFKLFR